MQIQGLLTVTRFAQLHGGEIFLWCHEKGTTVAFACFDQLENEKLAVPLAAPFPPGIVGPVLTPIEATVLSFDRNFILRLPVLSSCWHEGVPSKNGTYFARSEEGVFLRAILPGYYSRDQNCYIDIATGLLQVNKETRQFMQPKTPRAFATRWKLLTDEAEPQLILAYEDEG